MAILLTGSTGYIGAHIATNLLTGYSDPLNLLVRARDEQEARERLWRSLQLHLDFPQFREYLDSRIRIFRGDLTDAKFGLADDEYTRLVQSTDSVIHCAASLNRKSEKSCLNVNLRGTLEVIQLAQRARDHHGLRRFSHVSTVAVAGQRASEVVEEDKSIDWARSDYDPYARTKKFCEHMVHQLLPDVQRTIFRPSIVLGDSRRPETNQFDMVRAFVFLAGLPMLPFRPSDKIDIVNVDFVAGAVARSASEGESTAHDLSPLVGNGFGDICAAHGFAGESVGKARADVCTELREVDVENGGRAGRKSGKTWRARDAAQSLSAVSRLEYCVRQHASDNGVGTHAGSVFAIQLRASTL